MACKLPLAAGILPGKTRFGKARIKVMGSALSAGKQAQLLLPCGQCIECRLDRSRVWATRLMHEAKSHDESCFLTLTYDDEHVPKNGSLNKSHLRSFFNDLRGRLSYNGEGKIKFFAVGEYGEKSQRPHYHAIVFGQSFQRECCDHRSVEEIPSRSGGKQYSHGLLSEVWPHGLHRISEVTFESAAYVARYSLKKVTGAAAFDHYGDRLPEFLSSSNGLAKEWFEKWKADVYPADQVVLPGRGSFMPPKYYDYLLEKSDPDLFAKVKASRADREKLTRENYDKLLYEKYIGNEVKKRVVKETLKREL